MGAEGIQWGDGPVGHRGTTQPRVRAVTLAPSTLRSQSVIGAVSGVSCSDLIALRLNDSVTNEWVNEATMATAMVVTPAVLALMAQSPSRQMAT